LRPLLAAGVASAALTSTALTGPVFALLVYNSVLPRRSLESLSILTLGMAGLYGLAALVDYVRARLLARAARHFAASLSGAVFAAQHRLALVQAGAGDGLQPIRDLEAVRAFLAGTALTAVFDAPFMPLMVAAIFVLHPLLGAFAIASAALLIGLMLAAEPAGADRASAAEALRWELAASSVRDAEAIAAMGLLPGLSARWEAVEQRRLAEQMRMTRRTNAAAAAIKAARPALQSGMLGVGAYLTITGASSAGAMVAASILLSRVLAPVETLIANWRPLRAARSAYLRLDPLLAELPERGDGAHSCERPHRSLAVEGLAAAAPGATEPALRNVTFRIEAGNVLGVTGGNGAGKSTLARALVNVWPLRAGAVRIDGRTLASWDRDSMGRLGRHIGYLPQGAGLIAGTVGDNIARFDAQAAPRDVVAAVRAAGIEAMIARLPAGLQTRAGLTAALSAGQRQRIALARALYGEPFLVVLDEPDAGLDAEGLDCLNRAIAAMRRRRGIVVVMTHDRRVLASADRILMLEAGSARLCDGAAASGLRAKQDLAPQPV
jgi:ATP-binding cassette subfamily C protein